MRMEEATKLKRDDMARNMALLRFEVAKAERIGEVEIVWGAQWEETPGRYRSYLKVKQAGEMSAAVIQRLAELRETLDQWERNECDFPMPKE